MGFNFWIEYKQGRNNIVANTLSRRNEEQHNPTYLNMLYVISRFSSILLKQLKEECKSLTELIDITNQLQ